MNKNYTKTLTTILWLSSLTAVSFGDDKDVTSHVTQHNHWRYPRKTLPLLPRFSQKQEKSHGQKEKQKTTEQPQYQKKLQNKSTRQLMLKKIEHNDKGIKFMTTPSKLTQQSRLRQLKNQKHLVIKQRRQRPFKKLLWNAKPFIPVQPHSTVTQLQPKKLQKFVQNTDKSKPLLATTKPLSLPTHFKVQNNSSAPSLSSALSSKAIPKIEAEKNKKISFIADGYKLQNVPGDGLCGYWAILTAEKAQNAGAASIQITKKEVLELLKKLANCITNIQASNSKSKTGEYSGILYGLDLLMQEEHVTAYSDLCEKIKKGTIQLDTPLTALLAKEIRCDIVCKWIRRNNYGQLSHRQDIYSSGIMNAKKITIYYEGNGSSGHYQAIIPEHISVNFIK
ncbi:MAG: hypothetical protein LBB11_03170 [Puniceicoccales bacterium]|jgi:hypothetical protein|nr:hypothetical protein [Puniceicoccales bacterium]